MDIVYQAGGFRNETGAFDSWNHAECSAFGRLHRGHGFDYDEHHDGS